MRRKGKGFTLVELLVVLAIISLLITIVAPNYVGRVGKAEEAVLKEDLLIMRDALDKHYADAGAYPNSLEELVSKRYLRAIPADPVTQSAQTWVAVPPANGAKGGVYDVRSGAKGKSSSGKAYAEL
jgi:general secretion pathway protein G